VAAAVLRARDGRAVVRGVGGSPSSGRARGVPGWERAEEIRRSARGLAPARPGGFILRLTERIFLPRKLSFVLNYVDICTFYSPNFIVRK
jgi:hypothetical protein